MSQFVRSLLRSQLEKIWDKLGARIELRRKRSYKPFGHERRFDYQKRDERQTIARTGQRRTLREHTYYDRMQELVAIVEKHL